jgi:hypothetical protein
MNNIEGLLLYTYYTHLLFIPFDKCINGKTRMFPSLDLLVESLRMTSPRGSKSRFSEISEFRVSGGHLEPF